MISLAGILWTSLFTASEIEFTISDIPLGRHYGGFWSAPLDDCPGEDLLVLKHHPDRGREIEIYWQRKDGRFPDRPDRRIGVKSDVVAFSLADVRPDPGHEILLFTRSSGFSYSSSKDGYRDNAEKILSWPLFCDLPAPDELPYLSSVKDIDRDGDVEILLPGPRRWGLFRKTASENPSFELSDQFAVTYLDSPPRRAHPHSFTVALEWTSPPAPFAHLIHLESADREERGEDLLRADRWLSAALLGEIDGDGRDDVMLLGAQGQTLVATTHLQKSDGGFGTPQPWVSADDPSSFRLVDLDGDGRLDILDVQSRGPDVHVLRFFRNRQGSFDFARADQTLKCSGYAATPAVLDLDGDDRLELVVLSFDLPKKTDLSGFTVEQRLSGYRSATAPRLFETRPALRESERYLAGELEHVKRYTLEADLSGRGARDLVYPDRHGNLVARRVLDGLKLERTPYWQYRPQHRIWQVRVKELNGDGRSDLVLRHPRSLRVLVSRR